MAKITINLTSEEAEELLIALSLRHWHLRTAKQCDPTAYNLGERFGSVFTKTFGWSNPDIWESTYLGEKKVTVKGI